MTTKEFDLITATITDLKHAAHIIDDQRDKAHILHRADALEWVLSIATIPESRQSADKEGW